MKIIDAHTHIGFFGSWARFDFEKIRATHLPEDVLCRIYHGNAAKLLGL